MSERRLVIAVDCDDVLIASAKKVIDAYNEKYGRNMLYSEFYSNDIKRWGTVSIKEASDRVRSVYREVLNDKLSPDRTTIEIVKSLSKIHELHVVTGRDDEFRDMTESMVNDYFPDCFKSIQHTNHFNEKRRSKGEVCKELNADVLIDDHVVHIRSVLAFGLKEVIVFGELPWNKTIEIPDGAVRCINWTLVEKEINRIASR